MKEMALPTRSSSNPQPETETTAATPTKKNSPPTNNRRVTPSTPSTWQEQKCQKEREVQRPMLEVERLRQKAETLQRLEEVQRESERLKRSLGQLGKAYSPFYESDETPLVVGNSTGAEDYEDFESGYSDYGSEVEESRPEYTSGNGSGHSPVPAPTGIRHEMSNIVKRRQPRNRQSELGVYDETAADRDVEIQSPNGRGSSPSRSPRGRRAATEPRWNSISARELLSKIATAILTDIDDETLQRENTEMVLVVIALIKEAIIGILIAFAVISFALFLDHHFLLKFPTAGNLRRATMSLVNDRETMINMEESSGLKFMDMGQYNFMVFEINSVTKKKAFATSLLEESSADIERMDADLNQYRQELPKLLALLDLDKFCPPCHWSKGLTCARRVKVLQNQYGVPRHMAKLAAMAQSSCRKSDKDLENEENAKKPMEVKIMKNWNKNKKDYCGECEWDDKMTCDEKVEFLKSQYEMPDDTAKASVFVSKECTVSFQKKSH